MRFVKLLQGQDKAKFLLFSLLILLGFFLGVNSDRLRGFPLSFLPPEVALAETISARQLKEALVQKDFTLINVHTPYEGEIEKTDMFIDYDAMMANQEKLPQDKNAPIVLYCRSGRMSAEALQTLKDMGYTNVSHLAGGMEAWQEAGYQVLDLAKLPEAVLPSGGFELPVSWGNIGPRLVELGVIDLAKFEEVMKLTDEQREILTKGGDYPIKIDSGNSHFVVNLLWALGLAQKSLVYELGPMGQEYKDQKGNFASTGGWTLARGEAVNYLGKFELIPLTDEQQEKVSEIAKNVYRPCCGNPTWFPDCNHGMAALAAIELMVSAGIPDEEIYKNLLGLNSFWFPSSYLSIATYYARQGTDWAEVDAKLVLGEDFSSGQGASQIAQQVGPLPYEGFQGGSCGA